MAVSAHGVGTCQTLVVEVELASCNQLPVNVITQSKRSSGSKRRCNTTPRLGKEEEGLVWLGQVVEELVDQAG